VSSPVRHGATETCGDARHNDTISPEQSQAIIEKVVKHCVDVVHQFPAHNQMDIGTNENFFKHFDAFYNRATGRVENNGYLNGDIPPQYQFNKCMASKGFL